MTKKTLEIMLGGALCASGMTGHAADKAIGQKSKPLKTKVLPMACATQSRIESSISRRAGVLCPFRNILILVLFLVPGVMGTYAHAREIHVAKKGLDTNAGTSIAPYLTISKAASVAQAGDVVLIHDGTYREWVKPARGGTSEDARITYKAFPGDEPVIKGSERITNWVKESGNVWRADVDNSIFGAYNPYVLTIGTKDYITISGARLSGEVVKTGHSCHLGDVYLNGASYIEKFTRAEVVSAPGTWYTSQRGYITQIWANFGGADPNAGLAEILVRESVFAPTVSYINYITVDGLTLQQAACGWAEWSNRPGLMRIPSGHHWIIQNCLISDAKCAGITTATKAQAIPEDIAVTGHHLVLNNTIERCGQVGIVGHSGWSSSVIEGNLIQNINPKREFSGPACGGIKILLTADLLIKNNIIRNICNDGINPRHHAGIWVDWHNQGVRITGNVIYGVACAVWLEMNQGINLLDNNIFIGIVYMSSEKTVFIHNLFVNAETKEQKVDGRMNGYFRPHSLLRAGTARTPVLKVEAYDYNNILVGYGLMAGSSGYRADYNVYYAGARKLSGYGYDANSIEERFDPGVTYTDDANGVTITFNASDAPRAVNCPPATYELIGEYTYSNGDKQGMEDRDGNHIDINKDLFGNNRSLDHPTAGPFETLQPGKNVFTMRAGRLSHPR